jgi:hypothetical protein
LEIDSDDTVYVLGSTNSEISGLSTAGVFREHYTDYSSDPNQPSVNGFIVKLSASGQRIWGTYLPIPINRVTVFNHSIYFFTGYGELTNPFLGNFVTSGTYQDTTPAQQVIVKFNGNNGQLVWGTYYGPAVNDYYGGIYSIKANETGIFVSGDIEITNDNTYFATTGCFQNTLKGSSDLFLSKFNDNGQRVWSTYLGGTTLDTFLGSDNLSILGNRIIVTGNQYGNTDNISTPNAFLTTPGGNNTNMFFAEFNSNGNQIWCSYFGGTGGNVEEINPFLTKDGNLYLWGATYKNNGITTSNGYYPTMINSSGNAFGFITKFVLKSNEMSTLEEDLVKDLILYSNPNNGIFSLQGSVLAKEKCNFTIYDTSGRLLHNQEMKKEKKQSFNYQHKLNSGNYILSVKNDKNQILKTFKMQVK